MEDQSSSLLEGRSLHRKAHIVAISRSCIQTLTLCRYHHGLISTRSKCTPFAGEFDLIVRCVRHIETYAAAAAAMIFARKRIAIGRRHCRECAARGRGGERAGTRQIRIFSLRETSADRSAAIRQSAGEECPDMEARGN